MPARRKFLRSEATETGLVRTILVDFALSHPDVRLRLLSNGVEICRFAEAADFFERVRELNAAGNGAFVVAEGGVVGSGGIFVEAVLSAPVNSASNGGRLRLFVNGRSVRDRLLLRAIREAYGNFLKPGKYPLGALRLNLPASQVDVNVHPQKAEVRFRDPQTVFLAVTRAVRQALSLSVPGFGDSIRSFSQGKIILGEWGEREAFVGRWLSDEPLAPSLSTPTFWGAGESSESGRQGRVSDMRYVGQVLSCFLLFEGNECVVMVDMHAAHERVTYYKLKRQLLEGKIAVQELLFPETIEISATALNDLDAIQEILRQLGVEVERFGEDSLVVRALPALLGAVSARAVLEDFTSSDALIPSGATVEENLDAALARLACHASVRSGRELKVEEAYELLRSLEEAEQSAFCPHGRPVMKSFSAAEIAAMFGRL